MADIDNDSINELEIGVIGGGSMGGVSPDLSSSRSRGASSLQDVDADCLLLFEYELTLPLSDNLFRV